LVSKLYPALKLNTTLICLTSFGCAVHVASYLGTSKPDTERDARVGRSKAYNKICIWEKALFDAQLASSLKNCADATIQASLAQYHLQNIPTAVNLLIRSGCFPRDHLFLDVLLEKAFERRCESKGIFSLRKLKDRRWNGERMECHDYTELVKCRGAGKGVWFKDDIKEIVPGQLVLVTRAWASCSPEESRIFGLYDHSKGKTVKGNLLTLARRVAEKCSNNPNSFGMDLLENLGSNKGYQGLRELRTVDGKAVIDTYVIDLVVLANANKDSLQLCYISINLRSVRGRRSVFGGHRIWGF
jgi:hypothetical protein